MTSPLVVALVAMLGFPPSAAPARYVRRAERVAPLIEEAVRLEGGDPVVLGAILVKESSLRADVFGKLGEVGLGQLKPNGAAMHFCKDLDIHKPAENVQCAARLLARARDVCGDAASPLNYASVYNGYRTCRVTGYSRRVVRLLARALAALANVTA